MKLPIEHKENLELILQRIEEEKDSTAKLKIRGEFIQYMQQFLGKGYDDVMEYFVKYDRIVGFGKTELFPKNERNLWRTSALALMLLAYTPEALQSITPIQETRHCQAYINERRELVEVEYKPLPNKRYQILKETVVKKNAEGEDLRNYRCQK